MRALVAAALLCLLVPCAGAAGRPLSLVWHDEFDGEIGPDWTFETGNGDDGWGNHELESYRRANASVEGGALVITARREDADGARYTSARMKTQGLRAFRYGRIEARMKLPVLDGAWPAFWMLGANIEQVGWPASGEIDVMERINRDPQVHGTLHWRDPAGEHASFGGETVVADATAWHVYAVDWDADAIRWSVDGVTYHRADLHRDVTGSDAFRGEFFLLLNFAVGGDWPGFRIDESALPARMSVDYVRVYAPAGRRPRRR